jgi:hypothetical protein
LFPVVVVNGLGTGGKAVAFVGVFVVAVMFNDALVLVVVGKVVLVGAAVVHVVVDVLVDSEPAAAAASAAARWRARICMSHETDAPDVPRKVKSSTVVSTPEMARGVTLNATVSRTLDDSSTRPCPPVAPSVATSAALRLLPASAVLCDSVCCPTRIELDVVANAVARSATRETAKLGKAEITPRYRPRRTKT